MAAADHKNGYRRTLDHGLQFPAASPQRGPIMQDTRNVSVLTALENFLQYAHVPPRKVVAAGKLLTQALEFSDQYLWNYVMNILQMETAKKGYRSEQAVSVLIAEQQAKARMEAFQKLSDMGPKPKEPEASA